MSIETTAGKLQTLSETAGLITGNIMTVAAMATMAFCTIIYILSFFKKNFDKRKELREKSVIYAASAALISLGKIIFIGSTGNNTTDNLCLYCLVCSIGFIAGTLFNHLITIFINSIEEDA